MINKKPLILLDLDETIIRSILEPKQQTVQNANFNMDGMAVYFRPYLTDLLKVFIDQEIQMDLGLFTRGTKTYADDILDSIFKYFLTKYPDYQSKMNSIFQIRFYRKDLNTVTDSKDLESVAKRHNLDIDNILLVDDLMINFFNQPRNCIKINQFNQVKGKDTELLKLILYLKTFDPEKKLVDQNVFVYSTQSMF